MKDLWCWIGLTSIKLCLWTVSKVMIAAYIANVATKKSDEDERMVKYDCPSIPFSRLLLQVESTREYFAISFHLGILIFYIFLILSRDVTWFSFFQYGKFFPHLKPWINLRSSKINLFAHHNIILIRATEGTSARFWLRYFIFFMLHF